LQEQVEQALKRRLLVFFGIEAAECETLHRVNL
jgi:hypothetical protein